MDYDYIIPIVDPSLKDLRCGRNASIAWTPPKTAVIHAGDTVGFAVNTSVGFPIPNAPVNDWDRWPNLYHPGPATVWLSKAPGDLNKYQGDGDWFKILSVVGRTEQSEVPNDEYYWKHQWGTYQAKSVSSYHHFSSFPECRLTTNSGTSPSLPPLHLVTISSALSTFTLFPSTRFKARSTTPTVRM